MTEDETASVMSSTFSLGTKDSTETKREGQGQRDDVEAEEEFSQVVDGMKKTKVSDGNDPVSRRPTRPHHSANDDKTEHPLSPEKHEADSPSTNAPANPTLTCLFCNAASPTLDANTAHMRRTHGLFIPERTYLTDQAGLITWLHDRIHALHECLYCPLVRPTATGIQTHMRDKGHCMIAFETEEQMIEIGQFYDFSSTYSDEDSESEDAGSDEEMEDADDDAAEDGWETDSSTDLPSKKQRSSRPATTRPAYHDSEGLHLPSGRIAGHRSLAHYFRQNLHGYILPEQRATLALENGSAVPEGDAAPPPESSGTTIQRVPRGRQAHENAVTRANGGLGMQGVSEAGRREVRKLEVKEEKRARRAENKYKWGLEKRANNQKHYRDPLLQ